MRRAAIFILALLFVASVSATLPNTSMVSLLHANWSPGSYNFTDESGIQWSSVGAAVAPYINTTDKKFGNGSASFTGSLSMVTASNSSNWVWGNNHTVEFWFYPTASSANKMQLIEQGLNGVEYSPVSVAYDSGNKRLEMYASSTGSSWDLVNGGTTVTNGIPFGSWSHIEIDYNKPNFNIYVNGVLNYTVTTASSSPFVSSKNYSYGNTNVNWISPKGNMDEIVHWGITLHFNNFTPPYSEYLLSLPSDPTITADFTHAPNPSAISEAVTFTDTSTGAPTTWNWTIEGVGVTNTTQNMAYAFSTAGTYHIDLNVTNATGSFSNYAAAHTVTNATGFTEQDLWLAGQYLQQFDITDADTLAAITNVSIVSSSGKSYQTTNGTGYLTEPFGLYTITFSSDGYYPRTITYVFDADGTHAVALTPASAAATDINLQGTPKDVKFHIQSFWGAPITEASIAVQGITTTTGSWDWVSTLLSIDLDETPIQNTSMSGLTDSNGDAVFLMLDSIKYNISVSKAGYTFPLTYISPQAKQYTISANMNDTWFSSGNDTLKEVNVSVSWVTKNATYAFVNVTYQDDTGTTTGGDIKVYRDQTNKVANLTPVVVMNITASVCSNSTEVPIPTGGASYTAVVNATTTGDPITRTFTHYFKGAPVTLPGWTSETLLWLSLFIIIFTAAFAGAIHSPQMAVVLCVESWVFWAIGWLDYLVTDYFYSEVHVIGILTLATFLTVLWNITEGKAKGKRSS